MTRSGAVYSRPAGGYLRKKGAPVSKKVKKYVQKAIKKSNELKMFSRSHTLTYALAGTGSIVLLNDGIAQGDNVNEREGSDIRMVKFELRNTVNVSTTTGQGQVRLLIVKDRAPTGALPAITDVMKTDALTSPLSDTNGGFTRFMVIYDRIIDFNDINNESVHFDVRRRLGFKAEYNNSGSAIASFKNGPIYALTWSIGLATAAPTSTVQGAYYYKEY